MATATMPAPIGGWNARDPLDSVPPTDALELVNFFPQPGAVYGRGGSLTKLTVDSGHPVDTLIPFTSSTLTKFLAACNGHIYNVTDLTTPVSLGSGFTSDKWQFGHFNDKVVMLNGADAPQVYDGSTLAASTVSLPGVPIVTGVQAHGTLADATYYYRVTATYTNSETAPSTELAVTIATLSTPSNPSLSETVGGGALTAATYYYKITATNSAGETVASSQTAKIVSAGPSSILVSWAAVTGATGYRVWRSTVSNSQHYLATVSGVTSYTDDGSVSVTTETPPVSNTTSGAVTLTWSESQNPASYKVYGRSTGAELLMATVSNSTLTWTDDGSITPSGAMPSTDNTGKNLFAVTNFKGRAFYIESAQCGFWYADAGAFQGNLNWFPLSFVFHKGGHVVMIATWSRDNGDGVDDLCAIISSNGEALVYQGTDPGSTLTWSLVGRFNIGTPLSTRAHGKLASAEIVLTTDGFLTMDEAIVNQRAQELQTFGGKIIRAANSAATLYGSNFGWECIYYPRGNMFLVNVPIGAAQFEQYVQNTNTGSWAKFTGWNARTFAVFSNRLYFGTNTGTIVLADTSSADTDFGYGDDGVAVEHLALTSFQKFNNPGLLSQITAVQLVSNVLYPSYASINIFQDYKSRNLPPSREPPEKNAGQWDVSNWDEDYWADDDNNADPTSPNTTIARYSTCGSGYALAISFRYRCKKQQLIWYALNFIIRPSVGV